MNIIVCNEKHGERYLDASTEEQWARSALHVLTERWEQGWHYYEPVQPKEYDGLPSWEISYLRDKDLRKVATQKYNRWHREERSYKTEKADYEELKRVVEEQDLSILEFKSGRREPRAWHVLYNRSDHEYESAALETVAQP